MNEDSDRFDPTATFICGRTAYSLFQEFCGHNGIVPLPEHEYYGLDSKKFVCTITLRIGKEFFKVSGPPGTTKKVAQHMAAVCVFNHLNLGKKWCDAHSRSCAAMKWKVSNEDIFTAALGTVSSPVLVTPSPAAPLPTTPKAFRATVSPESPVPYPGGQSPGNDSILWINKLNEFCEMKNFSVPKFQVVETKGPPHNPKFTMQCSVTDIQSGQLINSKVTAMGNQKYIRRMTAQKILMVLKRLLGLTWDGPPMPAGDLEPAADDQVSLKRETISGPGESLASIAPINGSHQQPTPVWATLKDETENRGPVGLENSAGCTKSLEECMKLVTHQPHAAIKSLRFDASVASILDSSMKVLPSEAVKLLEQLATIQGSSDIKMAYYPAEGTDKIVFVRLENPIFTFAKVGTGSDFVGAKEQAALEMIQLIRNIHTSAHTETEV